MTPVLYGGHIPNSIFYMEKLGVVLCAQSSYTPKNTKKSREETCGEGSGVEILENRPYTDGPGGSGQYTHKVYHIGMHIPSWFRSILPKAALRVEEESWNAYPYTRTRYTCPFVEKFSIDIETFYKSDSGELANVFNLSPAEKRQTVLGKHYCSKSL
ncbi:unnamed protein product [Ranitomeya imitator]|uniref:Phosphatidylinositol transfer protein N-terminal domain-containing protein n=1 Tax=Ranitomeya imitator TaxID=111125 RepID=A0ABN9M845_9NEOB|nr:unnamed protein product [Ranitomeya imitator]